MGADAAVAAVFEPVQTATTFEETVDRLGTAIRLGILPPESRLPSERELAEQLGISRSTLRQAITALVESGHLTSLRGRTGGTFVVPEPPLAEGSAGPLPAHWREVFDLRVAIEVGAVTLAAERIGDEPLAVMRDAVARMEAATEFDEYRRADVRFHIAIAQATGVPRLAALMTEVQAEVTELIAHIAHPPQVLRHSNADHARLIESLARHDGTRAVRVLRLHLEGTVHILRGLNVRGPATGGGAHAR
jgi:GntR family transcriptional repressor for pyruvate dehydrogenase complex